MNAFAAWEIPFLRRLLDAPWDQTRLNFFLCVLGQTRKPAEGMQSLKVVWDDASDEVDEGLKAWVRLERNVPLLTRVKNELRGHLDGLEIEHQSGVKARQRFAQDLCAFFEISPEDFELLTTLVLCQTSAAWHYVYENKGLDLNGLLADSLGQSAEWVRSRLYSPWSPLGRFDIALIRSGRGDETFNAEDRVEIPKLVCRLFQDLNLDQFGSTLLMPFSAPCWPLESFPLASLEGDLLLGLLDRSEPQRLLFHGEPGTGKTSLAASLCQVTGRPVYTLSPMATYGDLLKQGSVLTKALNRRRAVLVLDECDDLLNTAAWNFKANYDKGQVNQFLDTLQATVIFLVNDTHGFHESLKRRFEMVVHLRRPTRAEFVARASRGEGLRTQDLVDLLRRYPSQGCSLPRAVAAYQALSPDLQNRYQPKDLLAPLLQGPLTLGNALPSSKQNPYLVPSVWNLSPTWDDLLEEFTAPGQANPESGRLVLIIGGPGCGKTTLAYTLAEQLGLPLLRPRPADLLGNAHTSRETRLRQQFEKAAEFQAGLLLDGVEAFFQASRATQLEYSLYLQELRLCLESSAQPVFLTVRRLDLLDVELLRLAFLQVSMGDLTLSGARALWAAHFPHSESPANGSLQQNFAPGDFQRARERWQRRPDREPFALLIEQSAQRLRAPAEGRHVAGFRGDLQRVN